MSLGLAISGAVYFVWTDKGALSRCDSTNDIQTIALLNEVQSSRHSNNVCLSADWLLLK